MFGSCFRTLAVILVSDFSTANRSIIQIDRALNQLTNQFVSRAIKSNVYQPTRLANSQFRRKFYFDSYVNCVHLILQYFCLAAVRGQHGFVFGKALVPGSTNHRSLHKVPHSSLAQASVNASGDSGLSA